MSHSICESLPFLSIIPVEHDRRVFGDSRQSRCRCRQLPKPADFVPAPFRGSGTPYRFHRKPSVGLWQLLETRGDRDKEARHSKWKKKQWPPSCLPFLSVPFLSFPFPSLADGTGTCDLKAAKPSPPNQQLGLGLTRFSCLGSQGLSFSIPSRQFSTLFL